MIIIGQKSRLKIIVHGPICQVLVHCTSMLLFSFSEFTSGESKKKSIFNVGEITRLMKFPGVARTFIVKIVAGLPSGESSCEKWFGERNHFQIVFTKFNIYAFPPIFFSIKQHIVLIFALNV